MGKRYPLERDRFNLSDRGFPRATASLLVRRGRIAALLFFLLPLIPAPGCRLPAREWRWEVTGADRTWLESLGEGRACGLSVRVWVADRAMWPFPLPGSRRLFFGADDLDPLIIVDNRQDRDAPFAPARARLLLPETGGIRRPKRVDPGCPAVAPAGGRIACTLGIAAPRGEENIELDLSDALPWCDSTFVFRLEHRASWVWRRVGPGVPGF